MKENKKNVFKFKGEILTGFRSDSTFNYYFFPKLSGKHAIPTQVCDILGMICTKGAVGVVLFLQSADSRRKALTLITYSLCFQAFDVTFQDPARGVNCRPHFSFS